MRRNCNRKLADHSHTVPYGMFMLAFDLFYTQLRLKFPFNKTGAYFPNSRRGVPALINSCPTNFSTNFSETRS